ncbi:MAG: AI-2E family transporter [Nocardioidaceae bacterium]
MTEPETDEGPDQAAAAASAPDRPAETLHDYPPPGNGLDLGEPGSPIGQHSPFYIGFFGAVGVLVALALQQLLAAASSVILLVVVALFLAVGLNPAVEWLMKQGLRRGLSVLAVFGALVVVITLFGLALVPVISEQVAAMIEAAPDLIRELQQTQWIRELDARFDVLDKVSEEVQSGDIGTQIAGGALGLGLAVVGALINIFFVSVLTLYFLSSLPRIKRSMYSVVPASRRERVSRLGDAILRQVGSYVSGAFVVALTAGVTALVFLIVVGLSEYAVALAFVVMLLDLIPMIGATIAMVVVSLIALAVDPKIGLACAIFFLVYQQVENYLIYPRVMSNSVNVPGPVVVIAVLAGGTLLGVIGALLAIPAAAAILLLLREVLIRRQDAR